MKKEIVILFLIAALTCALQSSVFSQEKLKIAVIPKSNTVVFWKAIHIGAKLGATALSGVELLWRSPVMENDIKQQISIVEECISEKVSGIVLAPLDNEALAKPVAKAMKNKIPVIIFDSELKGNPGKDFISFVGINNKKAGSLAGEELVASMSRRGKIVILRYKGNQSNISRREEGFLETISKYQNISVLDQSHYVSGTVDEVTAECMKMDDVLKDADGIFTSYEQSTLGMLGALRNLKIAGRVKFFGFDTPSMAIEALKNGEISGLIAQDPAQIGFHSVKAAVDYIRGEKVPHNIDVAVKIVTRDNINKPEIQQLLALPSLSE
jgi:ribose transport system substrate-binding protein